MGVPVLPVDVTVSNDSYRVERTPDGALGIRLSIRDVHGMSEAELERLLAGRPYTGLTDLYERARPNRTLMQRLALVGALDTLALDESRDNISLRGAPTRGDVIARVRHLTAAKRPVHDPDNQLDFTLDHSHLIPRGNPELSVTERVQAELAILDLDASGHALERYRPLLDELGVTPACELLNQWNRTEVLVAGIRVATQTPPMRSGKRVVFISLDDGTGCSDSTFFEEAQNATGSLLFGTKLMVIRGRTRRTGKRGISIEADRAWDLRELWAQYEARRAESLPRKGVVSDRTQTSATS